VKPGAIFGGGSGRLGISAIVMTFYLFFAALSLGKLQMKSSASLSLLGAISYPVYLIHNRAGKNIITELSAYLDTGSAVIIASIVVIGTSLIIHQFVEKRSSVKIKILGIAIAEKLFGPTKK